MVETMALTRVIGDIRDDQAYQGMAMSLSGLLMVVVISLLAEYLGSLAPSRVEITSSGYPALADNSGLVWIQMTPAGQPNQVKIISENSTGAFEEVLLGVTT